MLGLGLDDVAWPYKELQEMTKCHPLLLSVGPVCLSPYRSVGRHAEWSGLLYPRALWSSLDFDVVYWNWA